MPTTFIIFAALAAVAVWLWRVRRGQPSPTATPPPRGSWFARHRLDLDDDDFEAEVRAHLAIAQSDRVAEGVDPEAARLAALKDFGNVTLTTDAARRVWTPRWLDALRDLTADVRYAVRSLARHPGFALTVIGVLTLGIGLNAAVFTMLKGIALTPLAGVDRSSSLAVVFAETSAGRALRVSYPDYVSLRDHGRAFSGLFGSALAQVNLGRGRGARQVSAELVTGNYFDVLGIGAGLGRTLRPSDEVAAGRHPIVVLSHGLWRRDFGADPAILGQTIEVNARPLTVVGVADAAFHGTIVSYDVELFIPVLTAPELGFTFGSREASPVGILADPTAALFYPQGYLRAGTTRDRAAAELGSLWEARTTKRPLNDPAQRLRVVPFSQSPGSGQTYILPTLTVLSVMGLLVLLIACTNIAGLVLVRGMSRRGEIAVRLALGATRVRIVRLLVIENLTLAVPGAALGLLLSWRGIPPLVEYAEWLATPQRLYLNIDVDALVIGFAALAAGTCVLVFGVVPAVRSARVDLQSVINADASPRSAGRSRFRSGLVVAQVAVSLLLLVGAGLAMRSVDAARRVDPGFTPDGVGLVELNVKQHGYDTARGRVFYRTLLETARAGAGIESATLAEHTPLRLLDTRAQPVAIEGYEPPRGEDLAFPSNAVGPGYFRTLRIGLIARPRLRGPRRRRGAGGRGRQPDPGRAVLRQRRGRDRQARPSRRRRLAHGGRRGQRREVRAGRRGATAVRLRALLPGVPADPGAPRPGPGPGGSPRRTGTHLRGGARPRPAGAEHLHAGPRNQGRLPLPRPDGDDAVDLRPGRHGAGCAGHLRARVLHRHPEPPRDRHPPRARGLEDLGGARLPRPRPQARRRGRAARPDRGRRGQPAPRGRARRRQRHRRHVVRRRAGGCLRRGGPRHAAPGLARLPHRSAAGAPPRLTHGSGVLASSPRALSLEP